MFFKMLLGVLLSEDFEQPGRFSLDGVNVGIIVEKDCTMSSFIRYKLHEKIGTCAVLTVSPDFVFQN